jgi:hypothetical protein
LPLGLIAVLGWSDWVLVPAMLIGVLIVFAFRQHPRTNRYAAYSSIYAAVPVFAIPPWAGFWFLERLQMFFVALLLAHLLGLAFDGARHGSFWAWLAPLIVFVIQPTALGLLPVFGFGALGAFEHRRQRMGVWSQSPPGLVLLAALGLLVALILLPLPRPGSPLGNQTVNRPVPIVKPEQTQPQESKPFGPVPQTPKTQLPTLPNVLEVFSQSFMVINLAMLSVLVCVTILTLRYRSRARDEGSRWEDTLPLIAATVLGLMVLLYGASAPAGGSASQGENSGRQSGLQRSRTDQGTDSSSTTDTLSRPAQNPWPTVVLALLTAASIAWVMLRNSGRVVQLELRPTEDQGPLDPEAATSRVREAYRAFLALCTRNGLVRLESETPLEFAQRVGQRQALALNPASALTRIYEPVRYGGVSDSAVSDSGDAQAAQRALDALRGILQPLNSSDSTPFDPQGRKGKP